MTLDGLKIAFGYEIKDGPWGGGNQVVAALKKHFENRGTAVAHKLEGDLDLIIVINPRKESASFDLGRIQNYKRRHPRVKIITRINDTDKSGKIYKIDRLRLKACKISDGVVFISEWVRDYYLRNGFDRKIPHTVIHNGPDENIFNPRGYSLWDGNRPMKIVTHHWSDNLMKGWDIYEYFDESLDDPWMRKHFEFTYIGRMPNGARLNNSVHISPLSGEALAGELKRHHVYLTAARWEACGMHQLEGACCGLPLLFIDEGGGAVETCKGFGIQFTKKTFATGLFKMLEQYNDFQPKMAGFPLKSTFMNKKYEEFVLKVIS
jgi:glycosyltransferase involved in cell wall biosynthesis